jgi:hypothetical protein
MIQEGLSSDTTLPHLSYSRTIPLRVDNLPQEENTYKNY